MKKIRSGRGAAAIAAILCALLASCSSGEQKEEPPPEPPRYTPPPPPPLDDLLARARETEKVGVSIANFNCVISYDESIRAYQRILDNYPDSQHAPEAKLKVRELGEAARTIRSWKRKIDDLRSGIAKAKRQPEKLHEFFVRGQALLSEAPEEYMRQALQASLDETAVDYRTAANKEIEAAAARAEEKWLAGDYRGSLALIRNLPEGYFSDLPDVAEALKNRISALEERAREKAGQEIEKARRAVDRKQESQAQAILRETWERWRGFEAEKEIVSLEREVFIRTLKIKLADAQGTTRALDLELFKILEAARMLPGDPGYAEAVNAHVAAIKAHFDKYLSNIEQMIVTRSEYEIRRVMLDKYTDWELKRLK